MVSMLIKPEITKYSYNKSVIAPLQPSLFSLHLTV